MGCRGPLGHAAVRILGIANRYSRASQELTSLPAAGAANRSRSRARLSLCQPDPLTASIAIEGIKPMKQKGIFGTTQLTTDPLAASDLLPITDPAVISTD